MAQALLSMLEAFKEMYFKYEDFEDPPVHDACVIHYLHHPESFKLKTVKIVVDTGVISYGRTNCYFKDPKDLLTEIDSIDKVGIKMDNRSHFWEHIYKIMTEIFKNSKKWS